jgi:RimJ/RimL family protein N-acetyltransferase
MKITVDSQLEITEIQQADHQLIEAALALEEIQQVSTLSPCNFLKKERIATQFAIRLDSNFVGAIGIERGDRKWGKQHTVELSFWLLPTYQRQGIMTKVMPLFLEKILLDGYIGTVGYEITTILCYIMDTNIAAQRLVSKLGFEKKAQLKEFMNKNGILHDELVYEYLVDRKPFKHDYRLFGSFHLRSIRFGDAEACHQHRSNPNVVKFLASSAPFSFAETFENVINNCDPESLRLAICDNDVLIGMIGLFVGTEDYASHLGEIGYWIAEDYWGKGIMSVVIQVFLEHFAKGFVVPVLGYPLKRICASVIEENSASRRILEKNGFEYHGGTSKTFWKAGAFHNDVYYSRSL